MRDLSSGDTRVYLEFEVRRVDCRRCGAVKRQRLDFLADRPFYTKRFAYVVGRRCRSTPIKDVGFNNKIRLIQRRPYGFSDEDYLRLKILTCMLPPL